MEIAVTGGTGFIGRALCAELGRAGHGLRVLTRRPERAAALLPDGARPLSWPETAAAWIAAVSGAKAVVHLAGEPVAAGRWTRARREAIRRSRVDSTRALVDACASAAAPPSVLVCASAIGYYGPRGEAPIDDTAGPGEDFLARVCVEWEAEAMRAAAVGMRVVALRIGVVLGPGGGALARMIPAFRLFLGGPLGDGRQVVSWIHRDDVVGLIVRALEDERMSGALNATAPEPRTMEDLARALGRALGRPCRLRVPAFALRLALGEMSGLLLASQRILPRAAERAGYRFRYPRLEDAVAAAVASG